MHEEAEDVGGQEEHAALKTCAALESLLIPATMKQETPTGGVTAPSVVTRQTTCPNHTGSYPRCVMSGWKSGREIIKKANDSIDNVSSENEDKE